MPRPVSCRLGGNEEGSHWKLWGLSFWADQGLRQVRKVKVRRRRGRTSRRLCHTGVRLLTLCWMKARRCFPTRALEKLRNMGFRRILAEFPKTHRSRLPGDPRFRARRDVGCPKALSLRVPSASSRRRGMIFLSATPPVARLHHFGDRRAAPHQVNGHADSAGVASEAVAPLRSNRDGPDPPSDGAGSGWPAGRCRVVPGHRQPGGLGCQQPGQPCPRNARGGPQRPFWAPPAGVAAAVSISAFLGAFPGGRLTGSSRLVQVVQVPTPSFAATPGIRRSIPR